MTRHKIPMYVLIPLIVLLLVWATNASTLKTPKWKPNRDFQPQDLTQLVQILTRPRQLEERAAGTSNGTICSICRGSELLADVVPFYEPTEELPPNMSCGVFEEIAQTEIPPNQCEASGIRAFYTQCCDSHVPVYSCEQNIRRKILQDYDSAVPPIPSHREPLNVTVRFEYLTVLTIDVQQGTSDIYFSILAYWIDPRLRWEIDADNCAGHVAVWASMDREKTEMWVPDMDLYNQIEGTQTIPDSMAIVYNTGLVAWNRHGGLKAFCQFTGVAQIPFDVLGCQLIVGPWVRINPLQVKYHLWNGTGLLYGNFEPTYNEYLPVPELAESGYAYEGSILYFNFFFRRSEHYYVFNLIVPTIILTYVSMGTFLLDLRVGERLSYGMSLALVVVAQQIATGGMIPVSNERLWIDKFIGWSFYWVIVGLIESVFVGYLYFMREDMQANENEKEEEKRRRIYDGMRESQLSFDSARKGGEHSSRKEQDHRTPSKKDEVDVDEWSDRKMARKASGNLEEKIEIPEEKVVIPEEEKSSPLTFKLQLQQQNSQPHQVPPEPPQPAQKPDLQRTRTLRLSNPDGEQTTPGASGKCSFCWKWMYTISLRNMDRFFFFLSLTTYTLFVIAMFVSIQYWGHNESVVWMDETTGARLGNDLIDPETTDRDV